MFHTTTWTRKWRGMNRFPSFTNNWTHCTPSSHDTVRFTWKLVNWSVRWSMREKKMPCRTSQTVEFQPNCVIVLHCLSIRMIECLEGSHGAACCLPTAWTVWRLFKSERAVANLSWIGQAGYISEECISDDLTIGSGSRKMKSSSNPWHKLHIIWIVSKLVKML